MRVVGRCEATIINPVGSEELTNVTLFVRQRGRLRRRNAGIQRSFSAVLFLLPLLFAHTAHGDINAELLEAAKVGDTVKLKQLVNQGADVNAKTDKGTTALMWAAYKNHIEFVKVLIDSGVDVNTKTEDGWTALMDAAIEGHAEMLKILIDAGADVNATQGDGNTASTWAAEKGHAGIVDILKRARAR
jgi:ankyrin repeat protein